MKTKLISSFQALKSFPAANNLILALLPVIFISLACNQLPIPRNVNLFEGDNAVQAVAKIKEKIGAEKVKVIRVELRQDKLEIQIQAPNNPKNIDEYKFEKGIVSGPEPVQILSLGKLEMTADKYHLTDLDEINFAAIPETIRQAIERAATEGAKVELISMDQQNAEMTNPQLKQQNKQTAENLKPQIKAKEKECFNKPEFPAKCLDELTQLQKKQLEVAMVPGGIKTWDLAWRIFVQGTRARKDFWADKQGKILENPYGN